MLKPKGQEKRIKELEEMDRIAKLLVRRDFELMKTREKREEEFKELEILKEELEDAKTTLEIRVSARTRELRELAKSLDQKVKERTKDLEKSKKALMNTLKQTELEKNKTLTIINNFTDGLLVLDSKDKVSFVNPMAEAFLNLRSKNLIGRTILELSKISGIEFLKAFKQSKKINKNVFKKEIKPRTDLNIELIIVSIKKARRKTGTLFILHDITMERRIETIKTEFVSLAAHQLRTPLSAIKWTLKMILDGDLGKLNKEQEEFIRTSYGSNERMITLVNDLLNVTRIEEGKYLYKPVPADMKNIIQSIINNYQEEIKQKNIEFKFKKPKDKLPKVLVDKEKICLAVQNLLDNAIIYTKPGGIIIISLKKFKNKIEFSIEDNGVGIPKEQQKKIFSKFFRAANVIQMETDGTGLGLYITKNIIEAHKGRIWFESNKGKKTTFYFVLPIKE
ncbi:MAG: ATP-binding protein [Minisyncoccales bacterium]